MSKVYSIGQAAAESGLSAKMIRHYEAIGLLTGATRSAAGYRQYGVDDILQLQFIRRARALGFSLEQISTLVSLWQDPCRQSRAVKATAQQHLVEINAKMVELAAMQQSLQQLIAQCDGGAGADCVILTALAGEPAKPNQP